jgi:hypothetical protein
MTNSNNPNGFELLGPIGLPDFLFESKFSLKDLTPDLLNEKTA